jgi:serine/threonine-protein kinase
LIDHLRLERSYDEAIRFLKARLAQFHFDNQFEKSQDQAQLALIQRLAGDTAGAKVTAEQVLNTLEQLYQDQLGPAIFAAQLSLAYAGLGEKDSALRLAERATVLRSRPAKDATSGPIFEENLAVVQTLVGENSRAISTLAQLLQKPYNGISYGAPITPALLRLDPIWDPLRADPAFQKLCEEKQP